MDRRLIDTEKLSGMGEGPIHYNPPTMDPYRGLGEDSKSSIHQGAMGMGEDEPANLNARLSKESSFNLKQRDEAVNKQVDEKRKALSNFLAKNHERDITVIPFMDLLEELIKTAGGESRLAFLEVGHNFVKVATRMPMKANLHPMIPEGEGNPRFHKTVTQILISMKCVSNVRWVPNPDGSLVIVELN